MVPRHDAAAALIELERIRAYEAERLEAIARGEFFPARLDRLLVERGAVFIDAPAMPMIGIALLGAGYAARIQLACWREIPHATVIGVWNRSAERARALAAEFGVPSFAELDALLGHPAVDAVDIATAVETHRDYAPQAAAFGKHVLCQKPLAPTFAEAAAIVGDCETAGVRLMVNENWRWRPWYRAARALLDRGAIGQPFSLRLAMRSAAAVATTAIVHQKALCPATLSAPHAAVDPARARPAPLRYRPLPVWRATRCLRADAEGDARRTRGGRGSRRLRCLATLTGWLRWS